MYGIIKVIGGNLYQWDIGRKVKITLKNGIVIDELHFSNIKSKKALVIQPYEEDGLLVADIPNILLQEKEMIFVHCIQHHEDGDRSICCIRLGVIPKKRPDDYIYDETETKDYGILEYKINELDDKVEALKKQIGDINLSELDFIKETNDDSKEQNYSPTLPSDIVTKKYIDDLNPDKDDALDIVFTMGLIDPVVDKGAIFIDKEGNIYSF